MSSDCGRGAEGGYHARIEQQVEQKEVFDVVPAVPQQDREERRETTGQQEAGELPGQPLLVARTRPFPYQERRAEQQYQEDGSRGMLEHLLVEVAPGAECLAAGGDGQAADFSKLP